MTPCEEKGYKVGDQFIVGGDPQDTSFRVGSIIELTYDDSSECPKFRLIEGECYFKHGRAYEHLKYLEPYDTDRVDDMEQKTTQALRFNEGKPEMHWIDAWPAALNELTKPFMFGAEKYGPYNYKKGAPFSESYDCARRHMTKWLNGQDFDEDTFEKTGEKVSHLAFAAWNILRLLDESLNPGPGTKDDRPHTFLED
jgi:hypothetical protein